MKKFIAAALASLILVSAVAPSFAATAPNCSFADASLCTTETLSPTTGD